MEWLCSWSSKRNGKGLLRFKFLRFRSSINPPLQTSWFPSASQQLYHRWCRTRFLKKKSNSFSQVLHRCNPNCNLVYSIYMNLNISWVILSAKLSIILICGNWSLMMIRIFFCNILLNCTKSKQWSFLKKQNGVKYNSIQARKWLQSACDVRVWLLGVDKVHLPHAFWIEYFN